LVNQTKQRERIPEMACSISAAETAVCNALAGYMQCVYVYMCVCVCVRTCEYNTKMFVLIDFLYELKKNLRRSRPSVRPAVTWYCTSNQPVYRIFMKSRCGRSSQKFSDMREYRGFLLGVNEFTFTGVSWNFVTISKIQKLVVEMRVLRLAVLFCWCLICCVFSVVKFSIQPNRLSYFHGAQGTVRSQSFLKCLEC